MYNTSRAVISHGKIFVKITSALRVTAEIYLPIHLITTHNVMLNSMHTLFLMTT